MQFSSSPGDASAKLPMASSFVSSLLSLKLYNFIILSHFMILWKCNAGSWKKNTKFSISPLTSSAVEWQAWELFQRLLTSSNYRRLLVNYFIVNSVRRAFFKTLNFHKVLTEEHVLRHLTHNESSMQQTESMKPVLRVAVHLVHLCMAKLALDSRLCCRLWSLDAVIFVRI